MTEGKSGGLSPEEKAKKRAALLEEQARLKAELTAELEKKEEALTQAIKHKEEGTPSEEEREGIEHDYQERKLIREELRILKGTQKTGPRPDFSEPPKAEEPAIEETGEEKKEKKKKGIKRTLREFVHDDLKSVRKSMRATNIDPELVRPIEEENSERSKEEEALTESEIVKFFEDLKLQDLKTPEFIALTTEQKLLVVRNLKNRIVDIVKSEAQTQYSEDFKTKSFFKRIWTTVKKEKTTKDIEAEVFAKIRDTAEGKLLIAGDFAQLTKMADERMVQISEDGNPEIVFLPPLDSDNEAEREAIRRFNTVANKFREIPYEWGQGKGKNKKLYDKVKAEYEKARSEVLEIEASKVGTARAVTNMLQLDSVLQMEQLVNTHPQVEREFQHIAETAGGKEMVNTGWNIFQTLTGGKNLVNKGLFLGGYGLRMATASMGVAIGITAPLTGALIGGIRGRMRGKETLEGRKKDARYGKKDTSEERSTSFEAEQLAKKLLTSMSRAENSMNAKDLASLSVRINYTLQKLEKGEVNFGDSKSSLNNQYNLLNNLNEAMVYANISNEEAQALTQRLESFSTFATGKINEKQKRFINKQMKKGALWGAGFATAGYLVRWVGEWGGEKLGWWGEASSTGIQEGAPSSATTTPAGSSQTLERFTGKTEVNLERGTPLDPLGIRPEEIPPEPVVPQHGATLETPESSIPTDAVVPEVSPENIPPINPESVIGKGEGIQHSLQRQIIKNPEVFGYKGDMNDAQAIKEFTGREAHRQAIEMGYIGENGQEIRIGKAGVAYQFKIENGKVAGIMEFDETGKLTETRDLGSKFEGSTDKLEEYEYGHPRGGVTLGEAPTSAVDQAELRSKILQALEGENEPSVISPESTTREMEMQTADKVDIPTTSEPTTRVSPDSFLRGEIPGEVTPYQRPTEHLIPRDYPQGHATYRPYNHPFGVLGNMVGMPEQILGQVNDIYENNITHMFPNNTEEVWGMLKDIPAEKTMGQSPDQTEEGFTAFVSYLNKLKEISGLEPKSKSLIALAETNEEYITRALRSIANKNPGRLAELRME